MAGADKVVAIHQPTFFPWLGYFNKIARADIFVVLDNVQFPKTGGTWLNRVRLLIDGRARWVTMPVVRRYRGVRLIREMLISDEPAWRRRLEQTLRSSYGRAACFDEVFPLVSTLIDTPTKSLAEYNLTAIRALTKALGLKGADVVLGSSLAVDGPATELLIAIVKAVGGGTYLCGGGTAGYQQDEKFAAAGLRLVYQDFRHPVYAQLRAREFTPGLSLIDTLMNCGFRATGSLVLGAEPSLDVALEQSRMPPPSAMGWAEGS